MAIDQDGQSNTDKAGKQEARVTAKKKRQERKAEREARRAAVRQEKIDSGKASTLCSLETVNVKKGNDGFHVSVTGLQGSKTFIIAPAQTTQVLRDLETAIHVIRGQH